MNILSVLRSELSAAGDFIPCERVQKHLNETLKAQDGDILRIGVVGGQKGLAQVLVVKSTKQKRGRVLVQFRVQLLDLCFQDVADAISFASNVSGVDQPSEITKGSSDSESVRDRESATIDPKFGEIREDRYKFSPLTSNQINLWLIHPYTPGETEVETTPTITGLCKSVPLRTTIMRASQPRIDIFMALPRPRLLDKILQYAASMSIGRVHFFASSRSDRAYFSSASLREHNIMESLRLGLEQGMRTTPGPILVSASLKKALEMTKKFYSETPNDDTRTIIAHPYTICGAGSRAADQCQNKESFEAMIDRIRAATGVDVFNGIQPRHMMTTDLINSKGPVILTLGPEGGFTEEEVCTLMTELPNPSMVSLGSDILRCEVALLSMIAQTQMLITASGEGGKSRQYNPTLNNCSIFISPPARKRLRLETEQSEGQFDGESADVTKGSEPDLIS